ncbi:methyltransferase domain-containing protein [Georgenia sp. H159]|uniref:methyltransferase domain-containing protein n=1 Tax=Georgenia sp. H159 TaxID=3076115 RepID=UPI002D7705E4|nr:methyltransferase domain-containing protein [Georgenia sp. H159]
MPSWDPAQYARFADDRGRPFHDLLGRVGAREPRAVVDLGCGTGELTASLLDRWPDAQVVGVDSSPEMVAAARAVARGAPAGTLLVEEADLRDWVSRRDEASCDVVVSNAALQWVPDHLELLPALVRLLAPGGWLAVQVPGNHGSPSHTILRDLAAAAPWAPHVADVVRRPDLPGPQDYLTALSALGYTVDVWETTYLHVLTGPDPVWEWMSGTGARPVLQALPADLREEFAAAYRARLREAYPPQPYGTVLPFRRVFAVAGRD